MNERLITEGKAKEKIEKISLFNEKSEFEQKEDTKQIGDSKVLKNNDALFKYSRLFGSLASKNIDFLEYYDELADNKYIEDNLSFIFNNEDNISNFQSELSYLLKNIKEYKMNHDIDAEKENKMKEKELCKFELKNNSTNNVAKLDFENAYDGLNEENNLRADKNNIEIGRNNGDALENNNENNMSSILNYGIKSYNNICNSNDMNYGNTEINNENYFNKTYQANVENMEVGQNILNNEILSYDYHLRYSDMNNNNDLDYNILKKNSYMNLHFNDQNINHFNDNNLNNTNTTYNNFYARSQNKNGTYNETIDFTFNNKPNLNCISEFNNYNDNNSSSSVSADHLNKSEVYYKNDKQNKMNIKIRKNTSTNLSYKDNLQRTNDSKTEMTKTSNTNISKIAKLINNCAVNKDSSKKIIQNPPYLPSLVQNPNKQYAQCLINLNNISFSSHHTNNKDDINCINMENEQDLNDYNYMNNYNKINIFSNISNKSTNTKVCFDSRLNSNNNHNSNLKNSNINKNHLTKSSTNNTSNINMKNKAMKMNTNTISYTNNSNSLSNTNTKSSFLKHKLKSDNYSIYKENQSSISIHTNTTKLTNRTKITNMSNETRNKRKSLYRKKFSKLTGLLFDYFKMECKDLSNSINNISNKRNNNHISMDANNLYSNIVSSNNIKGKDYKKKHITSYDNKIKNNDYDYILQYLKTLNITKEVLYDRHSTCVILNFLNTDFIDFLTQVIVSNYFRIKNKKNKLETDTLIDKNNILLRKLNRNCSKSSNNTTKNNINNNCNIRNTNRNNNEDDIYIDLLYKLLLHRSSFKLSIKKSADIFIRNNSNNNTNDNSVLKGIKEIEFNIDEFRSELLHMQNDLVYNLSTIESILKKEEYELLNNIKSQVITDTNKSSIGIYDYDSIRDEKEKMLNFELVSPHLNSLSNDIEKDNQLNTFYSPCLKEIKEYCKIDFNELNKNNYNTYYNLSTSNYNNTSLFNIKEQEILMLNEDNNDSKGSCTYNKLFKYNDKERSSNVNNSNDYIKKTFSYDNDQEYDNNFTH